MGAGVGKGSHQFSGNHDTNFVIIFRIWRRLGVLVRLRYFCHNSHIINFLGVWASAQRFFYKQSAISYE